VSRSEPKFQVGEVAILQPPHPSASSYWGQETTILQVVWIEGVDDAMHGVHSGWSYQTDIEAPPPTDLPEDQHNGWIWAEYDLKKKYDSGTAFDDLIAELQDSELTVQHN
jgi:hypothetical protein